MAAPLAIPATPNRPATVPIEATAEATVAQMTVKFAVDLGSATNFDALRGLWNATRSGHAALFEGLLPLVAVRENSRSRTAELRLIVGPLADADAAAKLCATLTAAHRACQPTPFEGRPFALSANEPGSRVAPVPASPSSTRPPTRLAP
jgi:hypothetical protein